MTKNLVAKFHFVQTMETDCDLTCSEQNDRLHTGELGGVHMERLQLLDLLLEYPDVVHEGHHPVGRHGAGVETGSREEGGDVKGHVTLGGVQDEQLGPDQAEETHLVRHLELGEPGDVPGPLHPGEHDPGGHLADLLDVGEVGLHLDPVSGGVGLRPEQHGDVGGEVAGGSSQRVGAAEPESHQTLVGRDPARLDSLLPHPSLETLLEPAVLALVAVVLVYRAVLVAPAGVGQVPSHRPLEETLAALARHLSVVLPTGLVRADHADQVLVVLVLVDAVPVRGLGHVGGGHAGGGGGYEARAAVGEALDVAVLRLGDPVGRGEGLGRHHLAGGGGDRGGGDHGVPPARHMGRLGRH